MTKIKSICLTLPIAMALLWWLADPTAFRHFDLSALRLPLLNLTGIVAVCVMSACMILAMRLPAINAFVGGLDRSYRLHKWLGITALGAAVLHWMLVKLPILALGLPELSAPAAPGQALLDLFQQQYGAAVQIGDTAFKVFVILTVLALVRRFPYRHFFRTHRLLALVFPFLVYHSIILLEFDYWSEPVAWVMVALVAAGTLSAVNSLLRRIGKRRRVVGIIDDLVYLEDGDILKVVIEFKEQWPGHEAGQFAFVTFDQKEGAHPFTLSSPWTNNGKAFFLIKGLGDYTSGLREKLHVGNYVDVEGPYGQFDFDSGKARQIWVAGGIGIAPFVARAKKLAEEGGDPHTQVDLFYSANAVDELMLDRINKSAERAIIKLHLIVPQRDGHLDFSGIRERVSDWRNADIWFCGPVAFGDELRRDAMANGLSAQDFHQELFEMR